MHIVGQAVLPVSADGGRVGDGVAMTTAALPRLGLDPAEMCGGTESCYQQTIVRWRDGADLDAAYARLVDTASADPPVANQVQSFEQPAPPAEVERLHEVDAIPWMVAALLAVLAAYATIHAIVLTVHRRRRDLAVFRALGGTPAQVRRGVAAHIALVVGASAAAGTVLGTVGGRLLWRAVAGAVGVVTVPAAPVEALLALPVAIVVLAEVAAVLPARAAGRVNPTTTLRAE